MKMMSLFDGSGGFPLAAAQCGITPIMASEVEPYPIAVTTSRFPQMRHLGDISKINGSEIEPVEIITFGSPCQDLSVAGRQAGLKHQDNGDSETTRSGLFMEAVRIIKEMRRATHGKYPKFICWENVPGAFSSNKGEDFRTVLEEIIKISEPTAPPLPMPDKGRWPYADCIMGDGWSIAYRVFDAQYWGVPQRRRRIYLVADLTGRRAGAVLFERAGLFRDPSESGAEGQGASANAQGSIRATDREGRTFIIDNIGGQSEYGKESPVNGTLRAGAQGAISYAVENHPNDSRVKIDESGTCQTLTSRMGTGGGNVPMVMEAFCKSGRGKFKGDAETWKDGIIANTLNTFDTGESRANELIVEEVPALTSSKASFFMRTEEELASTLVATDYKDPQMVCYCLQGNGIDRADTAGCNGKGWREDASYTLNTIDRPAVAYSINHQGGNTEQIIEEKTGTVTAAVNSSGNNKLSVAYGLDRASFNQGKNALYNFSVLHDQQPTLTAKGPGAVCQPTPKEAHDFISENNADAPHQQDLLQTADGVARTIACGTHAAGSHLTKTVIYTGTRYIVRRLTPTECARLQGFPDTWGYP